MERTSLALWISMALLAGCSGANGDSPTLSDGGVDAAQPCAPTVVDDAGDPASSQPTPDTTDAGTGTNDGVDAATADGG